METLGRDDVRWVQTSLNRVMGAGLNVDGVVGPMTRAAIMAFQRVKGWEPTASSVRSRWRRCSEGWGAGPRTPAPSAGPAAGVGSFDGVQVATWLIPYLTWARANGWQGRLNSGYRSPEHSERICRDMCGAPTCPGRRAGRLSNHSGDVRPKGAIDVSDEFRFGQLMAKCPYSPRIFNDLPNDRIHFSANGH